MRILLINPNTSHSVSELIAAEARRAASASTQIEVATAALGVAYIETRFEALIGAYAAAVVAAEQVGQYDADRKSTRLNSSHIQKSRMPSSA